MIIQSLSQSKTSTFASTLPSSTATTAKSLQSCPTLCDPMDCWLWQPTRLLRPWDSPGKNTGAGCHFLLQCMKVKTESEVVQSCPTLRDHRLTNTTYNGSVQFSCSVVSDFLWPHGLQHARPPCPSPIPRACSNSCPLGRWCHPTISSSVVPSPPTFNLSQNVAIIFIINITTVLILNSQLVLPA